ncbi:MAG: hypothetical protein OJI67_20295 [Prosthecobacter sp.]|nr:hypothetical protein [Prosthecobacter sp.]
MTERRRKAGFGSLIALLIPGIGFPSGLALLASSNTAPDWLMDPTAWPWEFWVMGLAGTIALIGGLGDWIYHRWVTHCFVGKAERRCELLALAGGGVPMFGLLCAASVSEMPHRFLVPVMIVLMYTTALICYDEFVYHRRRCKRIETLLHRALVFGNGIAFLAWVHWCFVVGGFSGRV